MTRYSDHTMEALLNSIIPNPNQHITYQKLRFSISEVETDDQEKVTFVLWLEVSNYVIQLQK